MISSQAVWLRQQDDAIVFVHVGRDGAHEIARWAPTVPGQPRHDPAHFGPAREGLLHRTPRPRTLDEAAFLAIGSGASQWLLSAAAVGTSRMRTKMIAAVTLAKIYGPAPVDRALRRPPSWVVSPMTTCAADAPPGDGQSGQGAPAGPGAQPARWDGRLGWVRRVSGPTPPPPPPLPAELEALMRRMQFHAILVLYLDRDPARAVGLVEEGIDAARRAEDPVLEASLLGATVAWGNVNCLAEYGLGPVHVPSQGVPTELRPDGLEAAVRIVALAVGFRRSLGS